MKSSLSLPLFVAASALTVSSPVRADILNVPAQFPTINAAIAAARPGDTVQVLGNGQMYGENLVMRAGVSVIGIGNPLPLVLAVVAGIPTVDFPDPATGRDTFLSRVTLANGTSPRGAGIRIASDASPTISENIIQYQESQWGAGIYAYRNASPLIEKNIIRDCRATKGGGGIFLSVPGPQTMVIENQIDHNRADLYGAGVTTFGGTVQFMSNRLEDNLSGRDAAGLLVYFTNLVAMDNVFERNQASAAVGRGGGAYLLGVNEPTFEGGAFRHNQAAKGGGLYISQSDVDVSKIEFTDNLATQLGGGVFVRGNQRSVALSACDLRRNAAGENWWVGEGGGVFCEGGLKLKIVNCVLHQNSAGYAWNSGSGIRVRSADVVQVVNNTIVDNRLNGLPIQKSGLSIGDVADTRVTNNWFAKHQVHVLRDNFATPVRLRTNRYSTNSLGQLALHPSDGIAVPRFVNPGVDFHILANDPGVGRGSFWQPGVPAVDMDGQARNLPLIDIGADEFYFW